jgi:hypothetical protein
MGDLIMKTYYLHLRAFVCDVCQGRVVTGSTAVRERGIEKETEITQVGATCLSCGHRQSEATAPGRTRDFPPVLWEPPTAPMVPFMGHTASAYREMLNREELH